MPSAAPLRDTRGPWLSRASEGGVDLGGQQVEVELVRVRIEWLESESDPPRAGGRVQGRDDDRSTGGFLVDIDGTREHMLASAVPIPRPAWRRSTARRPMSNAGTGSGEPLASVAGAAERSMPVIATLA